MKAMISNQKPNVNPEPIWDGQEHFKSNQLLIEVEVHLNWKCMLDSTYNLFVDDINIIPIWILIKFIF